MTTETSQPLVSVICLCYNHERFVREAIQSVFDQTYPNVELIVVDDKSTDNSVAVIREVLKDHPAVKFIQHSENQGNCKSFNEGWRLGKGEFFIDLAADDVLLKDRIEIGVRDFSTRDSTYGVQHGDVAYMTEDGVIFSRHSEDYAAGEGDIYVEVVKRYFIASESLLIRSNVLEKLGGFDETLAYEDFDFLVRSSRHFKYFYTHHLLIHSRIVRGSMSEKQFEKGNPQQLSTYKICEKILALNRSTEEDKALKKRIWYEIRLSLRLFDFGLARKYLNLMKRLNKVSRAAYK
jgi:glycosyltransferase involved in cell wall biosynthesis